MKIINRKGQVSLFSFMLAVVIILLALSFAPSIKIFSDNARGPNNETNSGLDCSNATISDYDRGTCVFVDLFNPYFIGAMIGIAGMIIGGRILFGA